MSNPIDEIKKQLQDLEKKNITYSFILYEFNIKMTEELEKLKDEFDNLKDKIKKYENKD